MTNTFLVKNVGRPCEIFSAASGKSRDIWRIRASNGSLGSNISGWAMANSLRRRSIFDAVLQRMDDTKAELVLLKILAGAKEDGPVSFVPEPAGEHVPELWEDGRLAVE